MRPVAATAEDLTASWLTDALRGAGLEVTVTDVRSERVGTGQIGESHRLSLTYADGSAPAPPTLVAKIAGGSPEARERVAGGYEKEVGFYTELASTVTLRIPRCFYGAIAEDHQTFTLLLEDLAPAIPGVQAEGCTPEQAEDGVLSLVGLHAPRWNDDSLLGIDFLTPTDAATAEFLGQVLVTATEEFVTRYAAELDPADVVTLRQVAQAITAWQLARPSPFAIVHGDYRLDNLMFPPRGAGVTALDWQTVTVGPPLRDVAYLLGTGLEVEARRAHEARLVATYHRELVARGIEGYSLEQCMEDYRLGHLQGPMITVLGCIFATAERSVRADGMFLAMARRSCAAIRDLDSLAMLPS